MEDKTVDFLILGGGIAGTTAAETIRQVLPDASIAIATNEGERLYSRVLLPHFLRKKIEFEQVYLRTPQSYLDHKIELFLSYKAVKLNCQDKLVEFENGERITYQKLLIATGGRVKKLDIPNSDLEGIFYLRTAADAKAVANQMSQAKKAVVVGGGFIAMEFAHAFATGGLATTLLVREPYFWQNALDEQSGKLLEQILSKAGVEVINNEEVDHFEGEGRIRSVMTKSGKQIEAEIVGIGVGIESDLSFTDDTGIVLESGGIVTDEHLQTSVADAWAAGDVAYFKDVILNKNHKLGNWTNAMLQGNVAGENMAHSASSGQAGGGKVLETVSAYSITFFDSNVTFLGDTTKDEATQVFQRGSLEEGSVGQVFMRDLQVVGATLINRIVERSPLSALIKGKIKIKNPQVLSGSKFDLGTLVPSQ